MAKVKFGGLSGEPLVREDGLTLPERARQAAQARRERRARAETESRMAIERENDSLTDRIVRELASWTGVLVGDVAIVEVEKDSNGYLLRVAAKIDGVTLAKRVSYRWIPDKKAMVGDIDKHASLRLPCKAVDCNETTSHWVHDLADIADARPRYCSACYSRGRR
jgi:hypothetical protein